jgi:hypothetical protein
MGIKIGRDAIGNIIQTGDHHVANIHDVSVQTGQGTQQVGSGNIVSPLPPPEQVDIRKELARLSEQLAKLETSNRQAIDSALTKAQEEARRPEPDRDKVGKALDQALDYAKKAQGFAAIAASLKAPIAGAASWLGSQYHHLVQIIGAG